MSSLGQQLRGILMELDSDKVTARKKAHDDLKALMDNPKLSRLLTKSEFSQRLGWQNVYDAVVRYMKKEFAKWEKDKNAKKNLSNFTLAAGTAAHLLKLVIKRANHDGNHLKAGVVMGDLLDDIDLRNGKAKREYFGFAALKMLHHLLQIPFYVQRVEEIKTFSNSDTPEYKSQWDRILNLSMEMFTNPTDNAEFMSLCDFWNDVMILSNEYSCVALDFLKQDSTFRQVKALLRSPQVKSFSTDLKGSLIKGVNTFIKITSLDCRESLCQLGEATIPNVLGMFELGGNDETRDSIMNFIDLQITLHHPNDVVAEQDGAFFADQEVWISHLHRMHQNFVENLIFNYGRKKQSHPKLPEKYVELMAKICHQVMSLPQCDSLREDERSLYVTQNIPRDETQAGNAPKRKRVEKFDLEHLLDNLQVISVPNLERHKQMQGYPWLQILYELIAQHRKFFERDSGRVESTISSLVKTLKGCKLSSIKSLLFNCLRALLRCSPTTSLHDQRVLWQQVMNIALNSSTADGSYIEAHALMRQIIDMNFLEDLKQVFGFYANRTFSFHESSANSLIGLIRHHDIPNVFPDSLSSTFQTEVDSHFESREILLEWALGDEDTDIESKDKNNIPPQIKSELLWSIALKSMKHLPEIWTSSNEDQSRSKLGTNILSQELYVVPPCMNPAPENMRRGRYELTLVDTIASKIRDKLISEGASIILLLKRRHADPKDLMDRVVESLNFFDFMSHFLYYGETLGVAMGVFERIYDVTRDILENGVKQFEKLIQESNGLSDDNKMSLIKIFRLKMELKPSTKYRKHFASQNLISCLTKLFNVLTSDRKDQHSLGDNGDLADPFADEFGEVASDENMIVDDQIGAAQFEQEVDSKVLGWEILQYLSAYAFSDDLSCSDTGKLISTQREVMNIILAMLQPNETKKINKEHFILTFDLFDKILKKPKLRPQITTDILNILSALTSQKLISLKATNFDCKLAFRLLKTLTAVIPHLDKSDPNVSSHGEKVKVFIRSFTLLHRKMKFKLLSPKIQCQMIKILGQISRHDPAGIWSYWEKESNHLKTAYDENVPRDIFGEDINVRMDFSLLRFLAHSHQEICQEAIAEISKNMFRPDNSRSSSLNRIVMAHLDYSVKSKNDKSSILNAVKLLSQVAKTCSSLTKASVSKIFLLRNSSGSVPTTVIRTTLENMASRALQSQWVPKTKCVQVFLESVLDYVMYDYLHEEFPDTFPYQLLNCTSAKDFLARYSHILVPLLLWRRSESNHSDVVEKYAAVIHTSVHSILQTNFKFIVTFNLPIVTALEKQRKDSCGVSDQQKTKAVAINNTLIKHLGEEFHSLLNINLPQVISMVFAKMFDPRVLKSRVHSLDSLSLAPPNPPFWTEQLAQTVIDHFTTAIKDMEQESLFKYMVDKDRHSLVKMCLLLCKGLRKEDVLMDSQVRHIHGIWCLLSNFRRESKSLSKQVPFICWILANSVLIVLESSPFKELQILSLTVLEDILKIGFECCSQGFASFEYLVMKIQSVLTSPICEMDHLKSGCQKLLGQLRVNCQQGNIPSHHRFFSWTENSDVDIQTEIEAFLEISEAVAAVHLVCGIDRLAQKMSLCQSNLQYLVKKIGRSRGFTEDAERSTLHRFLSKLMDLASHPDPSLRKSVAKCLGQLGPCNLGTLVLSPEQVIVTSHGNQTQFYLMTLLNLIVRNYICHPEMETVEAASNALLVLVNARDKKFGSISPINGDLLEPFFSLQKSKAPIQGLSCDEASTAKALDISSLWIDPSVTHETWIKHLVGQILNCLKPNSVYVCLKDLCSLDSHICETLLPFLIHELICSGGSLIQNVVNKHIGEYFQINVNQESRCERKSSLKVMLKVVIHLRNQPCAEGQWNQNFWLTSLNYLHVAKAALDCSEFFTTILCVDIWCQKLRCEDRDVNILAWSNNSESLLNIIYKLHPQDGAFAQGLLFEAYLKLEEKDALYGCGTHTLLNEETRVKYLMEEGKTLQALSFLDQRLLLNRNKSSRDVAQVMHHSGIFNTLDVFARACKQDPKIIEYQQDCAWRLSQWSDSLLLDPEESSFQSCHSSAIKHFVLGDQGKVEYALENANKVVCEELASAGKASSRVVYSHLSRIRMITELELLHKDRSSGEKLKVLLSQFEENDRIAKGNFKSVEPIHLQRILLTKSFAFSLKDKSLLRQSEGMILTYIRDCCDNNQLNLAQLGLNSLQQSMPNMVPDKKMQLEYQKAVLLWRSGEKDLAKLLLSTLVKSTEGDNIGNKLIVAEILHAMGTWAAELKSESGIYENYFLKSAELYEEMKSTDPQAIKAFHSVAKYCDDQFSRIDTYMSSKEYEEKQELMTKMERDGKLLAQFSAKEGKQGGVIMQRYAKLGVNEIETFGEERIKYLLSAIEYYGKALSLANDQNTSLISRILSLWFSNHDEDDVNTRVQFALNNLDTSQIVPLMYQLAARLTLSNNESKFQRLLSNIITKCGQHHPFHTLPVLLALTNAYGDEMETMNVAKASNNSPRMDDRGKAAKQITQLIQNESTEMRKIVQNMSESALALINLAYTPVPESRNAASFPVPKSHPIQKLRGMDNIPVHTVTIKVRRDRNYRQIVGLNRYENCYQTVGGITAPKKIKCLGSDGKLYTQLVKGKDDLRQDAVMQQVFGLMNDLLAKNDSTRRRKLSIRQYKVVPLSQRSGILEWCEGTLPISEFLIGNGRNGAHIRYHPKDKLPQECRKLLNEIQKRYRAPEKRAAEFEKLCSLIKPVMRYFFFENFLSSGKYFERQLAYIRSVATSSMIGYILGLGDRHVHNILIDKTTAEFIHIDLGVAFEQGKILPTPETIPFRLTRDIVDGFGPSGVEGNFKRCCEATLNVLRGGKDEIMTILEVLTHDPLYNWSMTPEKAFRLQHGHEPSTDMKRKWAKLNESVSKPENGSGNKMAERVLNRVSQKLDGMEDGHFMSVEGQSNTLIQQARDPARLGSVFVGWQPYL